MDARLETLECKLMDAEDQLDALNNTIFQQQQRIDRLERQLSDLHRMVMERLPAQRLTPQDEVPPHY